MINFLTCEFTRMSNRMSMPSKVMRANKCAWNTNEGRLKK